MMIFVTNSSFIYMQYFGVGPARFSAAVRDERARLHVAEPVQHVAAQEPQCGNVLPRRAHDSSRRRGRPPDGGRDGPRGSVHGRAVHRARRRDAGARRSGGLVPLHGLLPRARGQRLVGLHDADVPARRYVRLVERRLERRHVVAGCRDDARRVVDGERDQPRTCRGASSPRRISGLRRAPSTAPPGSTSARRARRRRRCRRGPRRGADSRASSRCGRGRRGACS